MPESQVAKIVYSTRVGKWSIAVNALGGLFLDGPRGEIYIPPRDNPNNYQLPKYVQKEIEDRKAKEKGDHYQRR